MIENFYKLNWKWDKLDGPKRLKSMKSKKMLCV